MATKIGRRALCSLHPNGLGQAVNTSALWLTGTNSAHKISAFAGTGRGEGLALFPTGLVSWINSSRSYSQGNESRTSSSRCGWAEPCLGRLRSVPQAAENTLGLQRSDSLKKNLECIWTGRMCLLYWMMSSGNDTQTIFPLPSGDKL